MWWWLIAGYYLTAEAAERGGGNYKEGRKVGFVQVLVKRTLLAALQNYQRGYAEGSSVAEKMG